MNLTRTSLSVLALFATLTPAIGQINPASATTNWTAILYGAGNLPDPGTDQQTGSSEGDIVGNLANPSFFVSFYDGGTPSIFTDGELAFRLRLGADKNPAGYKGAAFVGMDLNADGTLDLFAGVDNSGSSSYIGLWWAGSGANVSPKTTTLASSPTFSYTETAANYSWVAVSPANSPTGTTTDVDGGGDVDYFLTFVVPFGDFVAMGTNIIPNFSESSVVTYVAATATQPNSLNQDLNGVTGNVNSADTWASLGGFSQPYSLNGTLITAVPEPSAATLLGLGLATLWIFRRRR